MIITKKALPRRTFVKGVGAALALPLLESMLPALARAQDTSNPVQRLFVGYVPNGVIMDKWTPTTVGADFAFPSILEPLAKYKDGISVLTRFLPFGEFGGVSGGEEGRGRATAVRLLLLSGRRALRRRKRRR